MFDWLWNYRKQVIFLLASVIMILVIIGLRNEPQEDWHPFAAVNAALEEAMTDGAESSVESSPSAPPAVETTVTKPDADSAVSVDNGRQMTVETGLIDINTASVSQLTQLPGIGPSKASAIVDYRMNQGAFEQIEDIMKVKGIGVKTFEKFNNQITANQ